MVVTANRIVSRLVGIVLRSPLHGLLSHRLLLLTVIGRQSGRWYTFPVRYTTDGRTITVVAAPADHTTWWLNAVRPAPVVMRIRGRDRNGIAQVMWERDESDRALARYAIAFRRTTRHQRLIALSEPAGRGGVAVATVAVRFRDLVVVEIRPTVDLG